MADDNGMVSRKEALERARRRKRAQGDADETARERKKAQEAKGATADRRDGPEDKVPGSDAGETFRQAQRNLKYAYASATERLMRKAAAMTAGRQDDLRACSVDEALEVLNHDSSATPEDMSVFAREFMAPATEKSMGE